VQGGFAAPLQSEHELLLSEREQALERKIEATRETLDKKEQVLQDKIQALVADLYDREREVKFEQERRIKDVQGLLDKKEHILEERVQAFLSDLDERQQRIQSEHSGVLAEVRDGGERIKGEAKYFQVTLQEKRETSIGEIEQRVSLSQALVDTLQRSFDAKSKH